MAGLMVLPSFFSVKCKCGPVLFPLLPVIAMIVPGLTYVPLFTVTLER